MGNWALAPGRISNGNENLPKEKADPCFDLETILSFQCPVLVI
jgi:hypothetical protein